MRRRLIIGLLIGLAGITVVVVVISWVAIDSIIRPTRHPMGRTPGDVGLSFEAFSLTSPDGSALAAWWVPATRPRATVILLHGFGSQRSELVDHLKYLHDAGYDVLMYDARACGQSGGEFSTLGWREQDDLRAAIDLVGTRTAGRPVFAMGFSLGAATAVLEGADDPRLQAVVANAVFTSIDDITWRAFPHFSRPSMPAFPFAPMAVLIGELRLGHDSATIRPVDTIGLLAPRPLLLITGSLDEIVTPPDVDRLWAAAGAGAERWDVPGGAHPGNPTEPFLLAPVEYKERVLAFFEGALGPTRP